MMLPDDDRLANSVQFLTQELELECRFHATILICSWGETPYAHALNQRGYRVLHIAYLGEQLHRFAQRDPLNPDAGQSASALTTATAAMPTCDVALCLLGVAPRASITAPLLTNLLSRFHQILYPGGLLLVSVPHRVGLPPTSNAYTAHAPDTPEIASGFLYRDVQRMLTNSGFLVEIGYGHQDQWLRHRALRHSDHILTVIAVRL